MSESTKSSIITKFEIESIHILNCLNNHFQIHNHLIMTQNQQRDVTKKCYKCKQMFGHPNFDNMCSLCYKTNIKSQSLQQSKLKNTKDSEKVLLDINKQKELLKNDQLKNEKQQNSKQQKPSDLNTESHIHELKQLLIESYQSHKKNNKEEKRNNKEVKINNNEEKINNKEEKKVESKIKCSQCDKKTNLFRFQCKHCQMNFCKKHRLPQDHKCKVDFVSLGKQKLKTQNPEIKKNQLENNQKL